MQTRVDTVWVTDVHAQHQKRQKRTDRSRGTKGCCRLPLSRTPANAPFVRGQLAGSTEDGLSQIPEPGSHSTILDGPIEPGS